MQEVKPKIEPMPKPIRRGLGFVDSVGKNILPKVEGKLMRPYDVIKLWHKEMARAYHDEEFLATIKGDTITKVFKSIKQHG